MKKARVTPIIKSLPDEQESDTEPEKYKPVKEWNMIKDQMKSYNPKIKQKWINTLNYTSRLKNKSRKYFEEVNFKLIKQKLPHESKSMGCLVDYWGDTIKRGKPKLHRGSITNKTKSKVLLNYFIEVSKIEDDKLRVVDYNYLEELFDSGVDNNATDRYGQSILHEVARIWHVDVARFMIQHGTYLLSSTGYLLSLT